MAVIIRQEDGGSGGGGTEWWFQLKGVPQWQKLFEYFIETNKTPRFEIATQDYLIDRFYAYVNAPYWILHKLRLRHMLMTRYLHVTYRLFIYQYLLHNAYYLIICILVLYQVYF